MTNEELKQTVLVAWKKFYDEYASHEMLQNEDFRSLCVGFCVALGMPLEDAFEFYRKLTRSGGYF